MATTTFTAGAGNNGTDAGFRRWGTGISTALGVLGFVKTVDTGQIDWLTVTRPTLADSKRGYEIWRFADALQATAPLYFRIDYGSGGGTPSGYPIGLWVTVGKGSSGAGVITNVLVPEFQVAAYTYSSSDYLSYLANSAGEMLTVMLQPGLVGHGPWFVIERSRTSTGTPTGDAVVCAWMRSSGPSTWSANQVSANYSSATTYADQANRIPVGVPYVTAMGVTTAPVFPSLAVSGPGALWQPRSFVAGAALGDVGATGTSLSVPSWGTYLVTGQACDNANLHVACLAWY